MNIQEAIKVLEEMTLWGSACGRFGEAISIAISELRKHHPEKPLPQDPYIDEVCSGWLLNAIVHCIGWSVLENKPPYPKVSMCLSLKDKLRYMRKVGTKTLHEYQQLIEKYGN